MQAIDRAAGLLEGEFGLHVAVGAGGTQDQDSRLGHEKPRKKPEFRENTMFGVHRPIYFGVGFLARLSAKKSLPNRRKLSQIRDLREAEIISQKYFTFR